MGPFRKRTTASREPGRAGQAEFGDKTVDVVVVAAGQPAPLISNMKPEAQKFIKLLKFDPEHPSSKLR